MLLGSRCFARCSDAFQRLFTRLSPCLTMDSLQPGWRAHCKQKACCCSPYLPNILKDFFASSQLGRTVECEDIEHPAYHVNEACRLGSLAAVQWTSWTSFVSNSCLMFFLAPLTGATLNHLLVARRQCALPQPICATSRSYWPGLAMVEPACEGMGSVRVRVVGAGTWSDCVGRRPFLFIGQVLAFLPYLTLLFHFFGGVTLYLYFPAQCLNGTISPMVTTMAYVGDVLPANCRAIGFGAVYGVFAAMLMVLPGIGAVLGFKRALIAGVTCKTLGLVYTVVRHVLVPACGGSSVACYDAPCHDSMCTRRNHRREQMLPKLQKWTLLVTCMTS